MPYPSLLSQGGVFTYADRDAINALISGQGILSQGNVWWVRPTNGNDTNDGKSPATAFQTLTAALAAATANQGDVVLLCAESDTAGSTTSYQSTTLNWNKDGVHLIGVNAGALFSCRSRVAFVSTYATASNLFTLSANDCLIQGIEFFAGVTSANPTGCVLVTGERNVFRKCHIAGIGATTNDIAGAYSLYLNGAQECVFDGCVIGLDTVVRTVAANSEILVAGASPRNIFQNCIILAQIGATTAHPLVKLSSATAIQGFLLFDKCTFISECTNYATNQASIFVVPALTQGYVMVQNSIANLTDNSTAAIWNAGATSRLTVANIPVPIGNTSGSGKMM